jgi:hypothetical protein
MRTLLNVAACGALSAVLASPSTLVASPADGRADSPPWVIANGQPDAGLYVPRDIQQAYAKGTRSPDGRPGPNYWQNHGSGRGREDAALGDARHRHLRGRQPRRQHLEGRRPTPIGVTS